MPKDITKLTLGELLSSKDEVIKRNALSILKRSQRYAVDCPTPDAVCEFKNCKAEAFYYTGTQQDHAGDTWKYRCEAHKNT